MFAYGLIPFAMIPAYMYKKSADEMARVSARVTTDSGRRDGRRCAEVHVPYQSRTGTTFGEVLDALGMYGDVFHMYDDMERETMVYRCRFESQEDYEELLRDYTFRFEVYAGKDEDIAAAIVSG